MRPKITMEIGQATYDELLTLSETIGYPPEAALSYAVRLVNACIREGLLTDVPARAWPQEAHMDRGKVIEFPGAKKPNKTAPFRADCLAERSGCHGSFFSAAGDYRRDQLGACRLVSV